MAQTENRCPSCGTILPAGQSPDLCPKCLLKAGLGVAAAQGPGGTVVLPGNATSAQGLPQPGVELGHYAIVRLLGQGGMGAVYEAEDQENGRRVALKVLSQTLDTPDARERFFREGRLAASINHPNSVYVFGTEEIGGTPVISMELMPGGTLEDRVRARGPLRVSEAVESVLQIAAGLAAAQRTGILHRDIKPSNCFVADDCTVKIGDFGLSISTAIRTEPALTATGAFLGTPAFCSPEQLRGDELNTRSDLYSVGATLFYLLTGRTPFEAKNMVQLLATVLEHPAPSPRKFRPDLPRGLARVILRCLEKQPGERFKSYEELARALAPYSAAAPTPATLGLRFVAGALDSVFLGTFSTALMWMVLGTPFDVLELLARHSTKTLAWMTGWLGGFIVYYGVSEWLWGATVGKMLCRLRVVGPANNPPALWRALVRAALYVVLPVVPHWVIYGCFMPTIYLSGSSTSQTLLGFSFYAVLALLFASARRRNGFAAVHDLITQTRVVSRTALLARPVLALTAPPTRALEAAPTLGPYHVLETIETRGDTAWLLGFDLRLLRRVWLHQLPPGTAPLPLAARKAGRIGRLRWLTGRRTPEENWDAYEALDGTPLLGLAAAPQPWNQVRYWLHDLATELAAAQRDGTLPELALDRVWITQEGRAKLLDFPAPGLKLDGQRSGTLLGGPQPGSNASETPPPLAREASRFLDTVAAVALEGFRSTSPQAAAEVAVPLPIHTREFLQRLPQLPDSEAIVQTLKPLLQRVAVVSRARRTALVAGCIVFPLLASMGAVFGMSTMQQWTRTHPGLMELSQLLSARSGMRFWGHKAMVPSDRVWATYIAHHYRATITNQTTWNSVLAFTLIKGEARAFAEQCVTNSPAASPEEIAEADSTLKPFLPKPDLFNLRDRAWLPFMLLGSFLVLYVGLPATLAALLFRGGLALLAAGVTFVRRDGQRASRARLFWRALVAWGSLGLGLVPFVLLKPSLGLLGATLAALLLVAAMTAVSLLLPERGLPDRLAGTWPVPR